MKRIMIIDDETSILEVLRFALEREGWDVTVFDKPKDALGTIENEYFDLLLTDLSMPGMSGLDVLKEVRTLSPKTGVLIMTAYGTLKSAIDAMREGAFDFIPKPFEIKQMIQAVDTVYSKIKLQSENRILKKIITKKMQDKKIIGSSQAMNQLMESMFKVASTHSNVLITGETGTGKELIARHIHVHSPRANNTFIPVNCSAIPEHLLESELFGYRKGAFTGADTDKAGLFEACDQGTLFLDEIGEIPFGLQAKLLRVLSEGKFIPLGSTQEKNVDVRVIAATHQNLVQSIADQSFREDLYYRIKVVELHMPALRDRKEDIPALATHFLNKVSKEYGKKLEGFHNEALQKLQSYDFPGNVRELEHLIEQAVIFEEASTIQPQSIVLRQKPTPASGNPIQVQGALDDRLEAFEREQIQNALLEHDGVKSKAAKSLGITFRSLRYRLKKLDMESS